MGLKLKAGYATPGAYLAQNERRNAADTGRRFSLGFALRRWQAELPPGMLRLRIGTTPRCLIQGSASADNVDSLIEFLHHQDIANPEIHVIDLIDLRVFGHVHARARFHRADAGELSALFTNASFDLVLQDHLLNCAPVATYPNILAELRRILHPHGMAFLHYTDPGAFPPAKGEALRHRLDSANAAHHLNLTTHEQAAFAALGPASRLVPTADGFVMLTLPLGNLEHFIAFEALEDLLADSGLFVRQRRVVEVIDDEGLVCRRNHCLIKPGTP